MKDVTDDILLIVGRLAVRQIQRRIREARVRPRTPGKQVALVRRGLLLRSVKYARLNNSEVVISAGGADVPYARIHHEGGIIKPRRAQYLAIPLTPEAKRHQPRRFPGATFIAKGVIFSKAPDGNITPQYALKKEVKMPKRPYMLLDDNDMGIIEAAVRERVQASVENMNV